MILYDSVLSTLIAKGYSQMNLFTKNSKQFYLILIILAETAVVLFWLTDSQRKFSQNILDQIH